MLPLPLPLIRVLDLTTSVAGASASRMLADLGAEVIVIERPGSTRETTLRYGRNKFSSVIDPVSNEGRDLLLGIAAGCQIVLKDADDAALSELDYGSFRDARQDVVLVVIGEGSERPGIGNVTAAAAMTALFYVRFRGKGQQVNVSFPAAGASMRTAPIVAASAGATDLSPDLPPSGCYACSDGSLALVIRTTQQLVALGEVIGRPDMVDAVTSDEQRREAVEAWTASRTASDAAAALRKVGIAAQAVLSREQLRQDPHLLARGVFEPLADGAGVTDVDGPRLKFSATPLHTRFGAPGFGEHTHYVLSDVLGLSETEIAALEASGVVASNPAGTQ